MDQRTRIGSNRGVLSRYRFSGPFVIQLLGLSLASLGLLVVLLVALVAVLSLPGIVLVHTIFGMPVMTMLFRNYYATVPQELYQAARIDGATAWRTFWRITMPLLAPSIAVVLILRTIEAFKVFDIIYVMTGGGPASGTQTVAFYTYLQAFSNQLFGYGAALAYLIVLAVFALAMVYLRILRQGQMAGVQ